MIVWNRLIGLLLFLFYDYYCCYTTTICVSMKIFGGKRALDHWESLNDWNVKFVDEIVAKRKAEIEKVKVVGNTRAIGLWFMIVLGAY